MEIRFYRGPIAKEKTADSKANPLWSGRVVRQALSPESASRARKTYETQSQQNVLIPDRFRAILFGGALMLKTYSVYTQCQHCGVYDRDPAWCDLCGKPKEAATGSGHRAAPDSNRRVAMEPKGEMLAGN